MKSLLLFSTLFIIGCSSPTTKLTKHDATNETRIVYGKIIDLNPDSIPDDLQITYTLFEEKQNNVLNGFDNKFPKLEPKSPYFWMAIPMKSTFVGVNSIRFKLKSMDGEAIIRDNKTFKPLLGINLVPGNTPVYIGDITIMSGTRKYGALAAETFDLKQAYIKINAASAKEFLQVNGIDTQNLVVLPFKVKTHQEAKNKIRSNTQL